MTNDNYIPGVMALVKSLKKVGTTHEIIILVPTSAYEALYKKIKEYGILKFKGVKVLSTEELPLPDELTEQKHYWSSTFFKLKAFSLEQFSKVILIDSDMLVQNNIDCLFEKEHMAAVVAGQCEHPEWDSLNSGLVVLIPKKDLYQTLVSTIPSTYQRRKLEGYATGDQDVIHDVFPKWNRLSELHLNEQYNVFWSCMKTYCESNKCSIDDISVVHFIGADKPWNYKRLLIFETFLSNIKHRNRFGLKKMRVLLKYRALSKPCGFLIDSEKSKISTVE